MRMPLIHPEPFDQQNRKLEDTGVAHRAQRCPHARQVEHAAHLAADPLCRKSIERSCRPRHRLEPGRIELLVPVARGEAEEPIDPQPVFGDPPIRIADEAHLPRDAVIGATEWVEQRSIGPGVERIQREIAPLGVAHPVLAELHLGVPPVRLDVLAQRRHLGDQIADLQRHRAVLDTRWIDRNAGRGGALADLLRLEFGGEIDLCSIAHAIDQRVAHDAPHRARPPARAIEQREDLLGLGSIEPGRALQPVER